MLRTCEKVRGEVCIIYFWRGSWVDWMGVLELAYPTACTCLFKLRPGMLSKTLSDMWGSHRQPVPLLKQSALTPRGIVLLPAGSPGK